MLVSISVTNYALIKEVRLDFSDGFTVITGETGAGKSILLGALGLITGKRADTSAIGDPSLKCIVEGVFDISDYNLVSFFENEDLDYERSTILRREILPSGKSRAFVNDTPVTLNQLQSIGEVLVDVHSQHKTLEVLSTAYQFQLLDAYADNDVLLDEYATSYQKLVEGEERLKQLIDKREKAKLEHDYQSFLFKELDEAQIREGEYEQLEQEVKSLSNTEHIVEQLAIAQQKLLADELGVLSQLDGVRFALNHLKGISASFESLHERVNSAHIELEDISQDIETEAQQAVTDPQELEQVNSRLQELYNLMQKHKTTSTEALIQVRERLDSELQDVHNVDEEIVKVEGDITFAKARVEKIAEQLHKKRKDVIPKLVSQVVAITAKMGLPNTQLEIVCTPIDEIKPNGMDALEFLFSANTGMPLRPLGKGVSGGELSRVMLALKAVLSMRKNLPTLIFDEIDTGVSGEVALKMGEVMKTMGESMQLISITHLPQIAGQGTTHYKVFKTEDNEQTISSIRKLNGDERILEIAEMLGGVAKSDAAVAHAKNLLN